MTREEAILLSAYTGFLLAPDFSEVHKFCENTLGRPIWTHEFARPALQNEIQEKLRPQIMELVQSISALRPVSREQVEKVWRGEWIGSGDGYADGELVYDIQKWFVNNGEELCEKGRCIAWMPLPAPPDKDNHVPAKAPNEPLTIEHLREMKDEPAYLKVFDPLLKSGWHIIKAVTKDKIIFRGWQTVYVPIDGMGVNYNLYRRPPEGEEDT